MSIQLDSACKYLEDQGSYDLSGVGGGKDRGRRRRMMRIKVMPESSLRKGEMKEVRRNGMFLQLSN